MSFFLLSATAFFQSFFFGCFDCSIKSIAIIFVIFEHILIAIFYVVYRNEYFLCCIDFNSPRISHEVLHEDVFSWREAFPRGHV